MKLQKILINPVNNTSKALKRRLIIERRATFTMFMIIGEYSFG